MITLAEFNSLNQQQAHNWLQQCCASQSWCQQMTAARPFASQAVLEQRASEIWQDCSEQDYLEAFEAHPMIGDVDSLKQKFANTKAVASQEQAGTAAADPKVLERLFDANQLYLKQNGFIFIICATGLSAQAMLNALEQRLANSRQTEVGLAAREQLKITLLRLNKQLQHKDSHYE